MSSRAKTIAGVWALLAVLLVALSIAVWPGDGGRGSDQSAAPAPTLQPGAPLLPGAGEGSGSGNGSGGGAQATVPAPCWKGAALLAAKLYDRAEDAYAAAAGKEACALAGLRAVAKARKAAATAAAPTPAEQIAAARALVDAGFTSDARAIVKQLVSDDPTISIPADLRDPLGPPSGVQRVLNALLPWVQLGALVLGGALLLLALAALLRTIGVRLYELARGTRPIELGVVSGTADTILQQTLGGTIDQQLEVLRGAAPGQSPVRFMRASEPALEIPDAIPAALAPIGVVAKLLAVIPNLLPKATRPATIALLPPDPYRGLGIRLTLDGSTVTIWERDFGLLGDIPNPGATDGLAGRAQRLTYPAAVWLVFRAEPANREAEQHVGQGAMAAAPPRGTQRWESYAHFACGSVAHARGRVDIAMQQYRRALDIDPGNESARCNLASLVLQPPKGEPPCTFAGTAVTVTEPAKRRLAKAEDLLAPLLDPRRGIDPTTVRARYTHAIIHLYRGEWAACAGDLTTLEQELAAVEQARAQVLSARGGGVTAATTPMGDLSTQLRPLIAGMRGTLHLYTGAGPEGPGLPAPPAWLTVDEHYHAACYYARHYGLSRDEQSRLDALDHLTEAIASGDLLLRRGAQTDPALTSLAGDPAFHALVDDPAPRPADPERHSVLLQTAAGGPVEVLLREP